VSFSAPRAEALLRGTSRVALIATRIDAGGGAMNTGFRSVLPGGILPSMSETTIRGYAANKDQLRKRLARIEGQVRGVQKMVDEDRYCIDVLQQISAIQAALNKVALGLVDDHVRHCITDAAGDEERRDEMTTELMGAVGSLVS
jgi:CsoR family transcriptional regulator, copper-sensing transcriptional repressor